MRLLRAGEAALQIHPGMPFAIRFGEPARVAGDDDAGVAPLWQKLVSADG